MKKIKKLNLGIMLALALVTGVCLSPTSNIFAATKYNSDFYSCRLHGQYSGCMHITLAAKFSSSKCTDAYWDSSYTHWPNGIAFGDTKSYTKSARGTYTIYTSLITQWASVAFNSETHTIYIYK